MYSTSQRNCFTKKNRLPDSAAYKRVFRSGHHGAAGALKWFALSNDGPVARLGTAIPKHYIKTAVQRNRIKRIVRESFRFNQEMLAGFDVIVVVRNPIQDKQSILAGLSKIWSQVIEHSEKRGFNTKAE